MHMLAITTLVCKEDPTLQDYKYAPVWAIVKVTYDENSDKIIEIIMAR